MQSRNVKIDTNKMICLSDEKVKIQNNKPLKFVIYNDSAVCKPCLMAHIEEWTDIRNNPMCKNIEFYFIFSAKKEEFYEYRKGYITNGVCYPVFIDTANVFKKTNQHIPKEWIYHKFLLDENDRVIFVGDPLHDSKMGKLFYKILNQKNKVPYQMK